MIYESISRTLFAASLLTAACGTAAAQSNLVATGAISPAANLAGEVSIEELAKNPANVPAGTPVTPVEVPKHRLPDGSLTSEPSKSTLDALPVIPHNVEVAPHFGSVKGFIGIHSFDNVTANHFETEPPDQGLAVNNNIAAEINNVVLRFFNATTGAALTRPIALSSFFKAAAGNGLADPQAFFDPTTNRWFLTVLESNAPIFTGGPGTVENLDVAISKTSNPLGGYFIIQLKAFSSDLSGCGGIDCLPDYPKAGYDANGVYISVNLFNATTGSFVAAVTYAVPKSKLVAGASLIYHRELWPDDFVVQPSVPAPGEPFVTAANGTEYLMEARNTSDGSFNVRVWAISNTNNIVSDISSLRGQGVDVSAERFGPTTVPSTEPNVVGPYCKSKGVTSAPFLDGGYNAFQATVQLAAFRLFGALPFGSRDSNGLLATR